MDNYDITNDGVLDLIVSRDDGLVEIYGYDETDDPVFRYSHVRYDVNVLSAINLTSTYNLVYAYVLDCVSVVSFLAMQ